MNIFAKNPIYLKEYETDNWFNLIEAKRDWLVFRAQVSMHIRPGETIPQPTVDLILVGFKYVEIPFELPKGFKVTKPKDDLAKKYSSEFDAGSWLESGENVYSIESNGRRFNVVASNLWIHVHQKRISASPIEYFYNGSIEKYNYYLENFVQDWIKIN